MLAIWVADPFYAWRSTPRMVVDTMPCWKCGVQDVRIFWVDKEGGVHNEYYLRHRGEPDVRR